MSTISPLFAGLDDLDQRRLRQRCTRARFGPNEFVFHQAEAGASLHIIVAGKVGALAGGSMGDPIMLRVLGVGDAFGEQALLHPAHRRTATIRTITATETLALHRDDFEDLRRQHPTIDRFLLALLAKRVDELTNQIVELVEVPATTRIYRRLVQLGQVFGVADSSTPIPISQPQLAALAGVKLRVTNHVVGRARDDGVVTTAKRRIAVLDWIELRRRAGLRAVDASTGAPRASG